MSRVAVLVEAMSAYCRTVHRPCKSQTQLQPPHPVPHLAHVNRLLLLILLLLLLPFGFVPSSAQQTEPSQASIKRQAQGYLYIEPNLARFEFLIDLTTALEWLALPDLTGETLPATAANSIIPKASALAATWCSARAEHLPLQATLVLTQIVQGEPGRTFPLKAGDPISKSTAMLGFMWEIPISPHPQMLQVSWQGFIDHVTSLPVTAFFGSTSESHTLSPAIPTLTWTNQDRLSPPPPLASVPALPEVRYIPVPLGSILWFCFGLLFFIVLRIKGHRFPGGATPFICVWLLGALLTYPLIFLKIPAPGSAAPTPISTPAEAEAIASPLLRNIYRAFDHRQESTIYDLLARSADGPLLKQLYLDTISALSLDESEAARVHVAEFTAEVEEVTPHPDDGSFTAKTSWSALGTVGHWGHSHTRTNVNLGRVTIRPVEGSWKITALEMLDQRRL